MADEKKWLQVLLRTAVEASGVDMRILSNQILSGIVSTPGGRQFAKWAHDNPTKFEVLIRAFAVGLHRLPEGERALSKEARGVLLSLPFDLRRSVLESNELKFAFAEEIEATVVPERTVPEASREEIEQVRQMSRRDDHSELDEILRRTRAARRKQQ